MPSNDYNRFTSSDSLIQQLCPEILAEIFTCCLPDIPKEPWKVNSISSRKAPLLLCSVCSSWRFLAISTPRLWKTLQLHTRSKDMFMIDIDSATNGIHTWLARSKTLPLSIRISFWITDPESDKATKCRLILEILSREVSRWESFHLYAKGIWVTPPSFGHLPMLHTLDTSGLSIEKIPFTTAPRLKKLGLYSLCPNTISASGIPWDQLAELTIKKIQTISMVVAVIQRCPRLESLCLWVEEGHQDDSLTFGSITQHDTLRKLHLTLPYVNAVIDRLTLPALTDLSLGAHYLEPDVDAKIRCSQLLAFFTRSNGELREFALYHSGFGQGELLACLSHQSCQTLTRLLIYDENNSPPIVGKEFLIRLTYRDVDDDVPLCPKLHHFELDGCYCSNRLFPDLLGIMVQSRCFGRAQDAQLKSLRIWNFYPISNQDYELLEVAHSNSGLEFNYEYHDIGNADDW